jgi:hypothetical protein
VVAVDPLEVGLVVVELELWLVLPQAATVKATEAVSAPAANFRRKADVIGISPLLKDSHAYKRLEKTFLSLECASRN